MHFCVKSTFKFFRLQIALILQACAMLLSFKNLPMLINKKLLPKSCYYLLVTGSQTYMGWVVSTCAASYAGTIVAVLIRAFKHFCLKQCIEIINI